MNPLKYIFTPYLNDGEGDGSGGGDTGDGDTGDTGDQGAGGAMSNAAGWGWNGDTPGEGDRPDYLDQKFKTVEDQAKGYGELATKQGKFGNYFGAPEGDYDLNLPEGVEGEFDTDSPLLKSVQATAKEMGLSQSAFDKLLANYVENEVGAVETSEQAAARVIGELGENGQQIITDTWQRLNQVLGPDGAAALDSVVGSADAVKAINQLLQSESVLPSGDVGDVGPMSRDELRALKFQKFPDDHPKAGQEMYGRDEAHTKKVDNLYKKLFPGEDRREVG